MDAVSGLDGRIGLWGILAVVFLIGCETTPDRPDERESSRQEETADDESGESANGDGPKRIILFVGDGLGVSAVTATHYSAARPLAMLEMAEFGLMTTHSHEFATTDSAASATALATGEKTHFNGVSVTAGTGPEEETERSRRLQTVLEAAERADWKTGLISTVRINHATPAAFGAHRHSRHEYERIAAEMSESGVDVLLGAGADYFRDRDDDRNLLEEMEERGYAVSEDAAAVRRAARDAPRLVGLMHDRDMPWVDTGRREMELKEMVDHSLEVLDRGEPEGFFLMVESARIDWAGHRMDGDRVVAETRDMDRAVRRALEYARDRSDTLVAVASDHETGHLDILDGSTADRYLEVLGEDDAAAADETFPDEFSDEKRDELAAPFSRLEARGEEGGENAGRRGEVVPSYGFFSAASRRYWDGEGRFTAAHTPLMAPIFAEGRGAEEIASVRDNADFGRQLLSWIDTAEPARKESGRERTSDDEPDNVVLFVADGLGVGGLTASNYRFGFPAALGMSKTGLMATHATGRLVNDEAGAATALATGHRTERGAIGMAPGEGGDGLEARPTIVEHAGESGRNTGLVTTSAITDPMPAAFYASAGGDNDAEVADQYLEFAGEHGALDFVAAGGRDGIGDDGRRRLEDREVSVHRDWETSPGPGPDHYLLADQGFEPAVERRGGAADEPGLAEMSERALEELSNREEGFFLLVDAGGLGDAMADFARGERLWAELREVDETIGRLVEFARRDGDTLLVATSTRDQSLGVIDNHYGFDGDCGVTVRCGGDWPMKWFEVETESIRHGDGLDDRTLQGEFAPPEIAVQYTWMAREARRSTSLDAPYSANFVPLFAEGPGAGELAGFVDQPELGRRLVDWARSRREVSK